MKKLCDCATPLARAKIKIAALTQNAAEDVPTVGEVHERAEKIPQPHQRDRPAWL
jgi:hypothetical protein